MSNSHPQLIKFADNIAVMLIIIMFVACDVNCCLRELYKSMTTSVTLDYSNESLDSSGYEDTERLKVSINRNDIYDVIVMNFLPNL